MLQFLFNKFAGLSAFNFIKKRLQHRSFPVKIAKFLRTSFFTEDLPWLLLLIKSESNNTYQNHTKAGSLQALLVMYCFLQYVEWSDYNSTNTL